MSTYAWWYGVITEAEREAKAIIAKADYNTCLAVKP